MEAVQETGSLIASDKVQGTYFDKDKLHYLDHRGEHFSVRGPLSLARPPQGYPLLVLAGASDEGQGLAARVADIVFAAQNNFDEARAFYRGIKAQAIGAGRRPDHVLVFPGVMPIIGATEAEAKAKFEYLQSLVDIEQALPLLSFFLGHDVSHLPLDTPLPELCRRHAARAAWPRAAAEPLCHAQRGCSGTGLKARSTDGLSRSARCNSRQGQPCPWAAARAAIVNFFAPYLDSSHSEENTTNARLRTSFSAFSF